MTLARDAGTRFETDLLAWLREHRFYAERLARAGAADEGDLVAWKTPDRILLMEAKARRSKTTSLALAGWLKEAQTEADNYARRRCLTEQSVHPLLVVKRPNQPIGKSYVVMTLEDFMEMNGR